MSERWGAGEVKPFQGFAPRSKPARRRKVLRSNWALAQDQSLPISNITTVLSPPLTLPTRLKSLQVFEYLGTKYVIYLDLFFIAKHFELCRFVNGPLSTRRFGLLSKATNLLGDATRCPEITWLYQDQHGWIPFQRNALWQNRLSREQADSLYEGTCLPAVEQFLAIAPAPDQISALPFSAKPHYRNLARRLACSLTTLDQLGFQAINSQAERFAAAFAREAWAASVQRTGLCLLCEARPIGLAYQCMHRMTCVECAAWKTCPACYNNVLPSPNPLGTIDLHWHDCLLPKPNLGPPRLIDFFISWQVCNWDGEILEELPPPGEDRLTEVIKDLCERYPQIKLSDDLLDRLME